MDSLRALGALGVLAVHAMANSAALAPESDLRMYVARLDIAVPIFFVLSGFLLYRPFARAHIAGDERPDVADYGWRRFLRIAPGYWVALTIVALWIGISNVFTAGGIASYYGFAQIYRAETFDGGLIQAWTIAVEVVFYAFLPVYAIAMGRLLRSRPGGRLRGELIGVGALFALGLVYNALALAGLGPIDPSQAPILFAFPAFLNQFAVGMALAIWSVHADNRRREGNSAGRAESLIERWPGIPVAVALAAFLVLVHGINLERPPLTDAEWFERHLLNTLIAGALLLPTMFGEVRRGLVRRVLANRALLYLGVISYGFYLYHLGVLTQLEDWGLRDTLGTGVGAYLAWLAIGTAGATLIGTASWYLLERPSLRQIRRIRAWRKRRVPEVAVTPEPAAAAATPEP